MGEGRGRERERERGTEGESTGDSHSGILAPEASESQPLCPSPMRSRTSPRPTRPVAPQRSRPPPRGHPHGTMMPHLVKNIRSGHPLRPTSRQGPRSRGESRRCGSTNDQHIQNSKVQLLDPEIREVRLRQGRLNITPTQCVRLTRYDIHVKGAILVRSIEGWRLRERTV